MTMEPRIVAVKSEVENIEYEDSKNIDFELLVKVEDLQAQVLDGEWCVENQLLYRCDKDAYSESDNDQLIKEECPRCLHIFDDSNALSMHNLSHLEVRLRDIKYKFIMKNRHNEGTLYQCKICDKILPFKLRLQHRKEAHKDDLFLCKTCNSTFQQKRYLQKHILYVHTLKTEHPEGGVVCDICSAEFKNKMLLTVHMKNCHSESAICNICNSKLKSKTYLLAHIRRVHYCDGKEHRCNICNKNYRSPRYLNIHKKNSHWKKKKAVYNKRKPKTVID